VPVHHALTKRKLSVLDRLTGRLSYCVWLFSGLIDERHLDVRGYGDFTKDDIARIKKLTKLSSVFVQQCRDQALWNWRSYHAQRNEWERLSALAKGNRKEILLKREPGKPFHRGLTKKVPVRFDTRTGIVETSKSMRLIPLVLRLSTLRQGARVTIPLSPAKYHLDLLRKGRVVDFQLVKHEGRYYAHICVKYDLPNVPIQAVRGVDLGARRAFATVLLKPDTPMRREDLSILTDGEKRHRLYRLNHRISQLQQARKWEPLRRLRHKRRNVAAYFDRLDAIRIARMAEQEHSLVTVGYPRNVKYDNYRGNGKPYLRRTLQQHFPYGQRIRFLYEECAERGVRTIVMLEAWTSKQCHRCGSMHTRRVNQSQLRCLSCGLSYNADWNAAINIGSSFFAKRMSRRASEGSAQTGNEPVQKPVSPEVGNRFSTASNTFLCP